MDVEDIKEIIYSRPGFEQNIGMVFHSTPEDDVCVATMHVDERNMQPFRILSGGATLALAETVAGVGSSALCPGRACVGMSVSGSHIHAAHEGETVTATARLTHRGRLTHVWQVEVRSDTGALISTVAVTNFIK